ncbi:MAG TPA: hypothetical protein VF316_23110 [Polyangiaceae bacterium]
MTQEHLDAILNLLQVGKADREGWRAAPEGLLLTFHVAHSAGTLGVSRVEAVRFDGSLVLARTAKKELFAFDRDHVFAVATDGGAGQPARRPGFG